MVATKYVYYMNVPRNEKGMDEIEYLDETMANVETFELTEEEFESLFFGKDSLFTKFDKSFGTIINYCEEDEIKPEDIADAYEMACKHKAKSEIEKKALNKVIDSLKLAKDSKTFWEIEIYLVLRK